MPKRLPSWNTKTVTTYANAVKPPSWKSAHFHELLSFLVTAIVAMHGALIRQKSMMQNPTRGL